MTSKRVQTSAQQPCQEHANQNCFVSERLTCGLSSSSIDGSSVARPAAQLAGPAEPRSLQDCGDWPKALPPQEIAQSKPLQRLQSSMAILQIRSSRQQRQEVHRLFDPWNVPQKAKDRKRTYDDAKMDLVAKVVEETRRLKRMQDASEPPSPDASANNAGARFSAIQAALRHGRIQPQV